MVLFVLRRIMVSIPTLLLLLSLTFFLLRLAPGGPFDSDRVWPPEIQANIAKRYGLNLPMHQQFTAWLGDLAHGDLRESFQYQGRAVTEIIGEALPASLLLGTFALLFALTIGIPLGCLGAWKKNTIWDQASVFAAVAGVSLPSYLVASLLILVFSLMLEWFPPALWDSPGSAVLPSITLGLRPLALVARLTRASMLEALASDYVRTAYGKGVATSAILFKHALKNSLIPVITLGGPLTANLLTGSFLVEIVFQIPGLGRHFVQAMMNRDYPLMMGVTLLYGIILTVCNLAVELLSGWADPRIRLQELI